MTTPKEEPETLTPLSPEATRALEALEKPRIILPDQPVILEYAQAVVDAKARWSACRCKACCSDCGQHACPLVAKFDVACVALARIFQP